MYHNPVLLAESIEGLNLKPNGTYVDVTFGGGGHSREILNLLGESGKLYAFDHDDDALANAIDDERFTLINANFKYLKNYLKLYAALPVDGILADLGISSHQIDVAERGFSIRHNGELDLRMNRNQGKSAKDVVNNYSEEELKMVFQEFGEIPNAWKLARTIVAYRANTEISETAQLIDAIKSCIPKKIENKYLAMLFQAIRIEVNEELDVLKEFLLQTTACLNPGGRLVVISYHSLEDRLVKNFMKSGNFKGEVEKDFYGNALSSFKVISRKPITAGDDELLRNNRSRSAKLRIAEKI
ncbi:MAG: 16S rRNA (cytosine(1402)-N(4))-methyltransferase RsmH [Bacteroidetes bacterium]|nr:16S rRNA (cytosine(1402)-N(4))-methyltransferase RsmH [Bacteroidota bacterium]